MAQSGIQLLISTFVDSLPVNPLISQAQQPSKAQMQIETKEDPAILVDDKLINNRMQRLESMFLEWAQHACYSHTQENRVAGVILLHMLTESLGKLWLTRRSVESPFIPALMASLRDEAPVIHNKLI